MKSSCYFIFSHSVLLCPNLYSIFTIHAPFSSLYSQLLNPPGLYTNWSLNRSSLFRLHTDNTENKSHDSLYSWDVTSLRLHGSVFIEPLPRSGLHNPVLSLLHACIAGCLSVRYLAALWPSTLQYFKFWCFNPYKTTHACNTCETFHFKGWLPSDDGHHWPKHVKALFYY
jgi:hypothetical protein